MRPRSLSVVLLPASLWTVVAARFHNSLVPEDPYAFPKYRVAFLNGLPVLNETANRWLQNGLSGGELEFLEQPWDENQSWRGLQLKSIASSEGEVTISEPEIPSHKLELMKMGPKSSYLCLIPPPPLENNSPSAEESSTEVTPVHTWSLLQPLSGSCLYHKQGWFTYAYCHNSHVRQFHELNKPQNQRPGDYTPEEDTEWEAYTLGRAPPTPEPGAEMTVAQEAAIAANVELARNAGSRYLVQRWGDGSYCEKIGRKREIEIQFHCSMTMTDTILFVKETHTCHYVLHIATPRLCGEPGFRSRLDAREEVYIRCREIVSPQEYAATDRSLPQTDQPMKIPKRQPKPVISPPPPEEGVKGEGGEGDKTKRDQGERIRKALQKLIAGGGDLKAGEVIIDPFGDGEDEVIVEFIDYPLEEGGEAPSLEDILRRAGHDIKGQQGQPHKQPQKRDQASSQDEEKPERRRDRRDVRAREDL